jgi:hypothetical protein
MLHARVVFKSGNMFVILVTLLVGLTHAPRASAWSWPVEGPVLRPFVAEDDPYAGGQHRGIDIGAPTGADVRAPATGVVSFAGQLPREGRCLTIRTEDGFSITLVHLGSIALPVGTAVGEGEVVGTIGPSGEPEGPEPYVHLGIRLTADPNGYLDPLSLLPVRAAPPPPPEREPVAEPVAPPAAPVSIPAPVTLKRLRSPRSSARARRAPRAREIRPVSSSVRSRPAPAPHVSGAADRPAQGRAHSHRSTAGRPAIAPSPTREPETPRPRVRLSRHEVVGKVVTRPSAKRFDRRRSISRRILLFPFGALGLALVAIGAVWRRSSLGSSAPERFARHPLRKMSPSEPGPEERLARTSTTASSDRRRVAVRERPTASRSCRRLRRALRHHGPVSPAPRRSGVDGQRHRRARNARHGRGRSRRSVAA